MFVFNFPLHPHPFCLLCLLAFTETFPFFRSHSSTTICNYFSESEEKEESEEVGKLFCRKSIIDCTFSDVGL